MFHFDMLLFLNSLPFIVSVQVTGFRRLAPAPEIYDARQVGSPKARVEHVSPDGGMPRLISVHQMQRTVLGFIVVDCIVLEFCIAGCMQHCPNCA
jgi:hypothetical protein